MKKIALLASDSRTLVLFRLHFMCALKKQGYVVTAYSRKDAYFNKAFQELEKEGISLKESPVQNTSLNPFSDLKYFFFLLQEIRKHDAFFAYTIKPVVYGGIVGRILKKNYYLMITGLGYLFTSMGLFKKVLTECLMVLYGFSLRGAKKVFFQNLEDKTYFQEKGLLNNNAILVPGSGVDLELFPQTPPPSDPFTFLLVARLLRDKGIMEFAGAARQLKEKYPNVRFQILGGSHPNPAALKDEEIKLVQESVDLLGEMEDVKPYLKQASVFVLPSYREGTPRAALEAMASGRPLIVTDVPGCREVVKEGKNGFLVTPKDVKTLKDAMIKFLEAPSMVEQMGDSSRKLAEKTFDVHKVNEILLKEMDLKNGS